ncbi:energy-coupling factor transporter transmembrane component T family protein [Kineococcus rhizosphaerae]|uniref:energy-coupling factor transporter transmembrane component T family protein n=1 Tax=Kineococcus rhizosphaerae TaxID=559628 RepID=UPI001474D1C8|nr:energy-coupling factor transporter transmembrane component T [Kineococcus rhizosphaerae]
MDDTVPETAAARRSRGPGPLVRHCGPLPLLAVGLLCTLGAFAVDAWWQAAGALAVQALCLPLVVADVRVAARRLLPLGIAALSVGWSTVLAGDSPEPLWTALAAALRLVVLVLPGSLLLGWIDPAEAGDHLAQRLRLPARVVVAAVVALGRLDSLADSWEQVAAARRVRGFGPGRGPVSRLRWAASTSFGLLVDAVRRAGRVSVAMDARGFAGATAARRSWALPAPWRRADTVLLVVGALVAAVPLLLRLAFPAA